MANLVEAYKKRITISEQVYSKEHNGEKLSPRSKTVVARCLANVENFLNEAFDSSAATQRSNMGEWKKFCLNLTTVVLPNLVANDLVIVSPMSSMTGYVAYVNYTAGSTRNGRVANESSFMSPFAIGDMTEENTGYTSEHVVETVASDATTIAPAWTPVAGDKVEAHKVADGTWEELTLTGGSVTVVAGTYDKVRYVYNNVIIPQAQLPTLNAKVESIPLTAKARRIAIYYSQMAAYQAKTDYGFDLGAQLAEKAVGQLAYEIDTEVTNLLVAGAQDYPEMTWSKTLPIGVSKAEHYQGFAEVVELAKARVYKATKRFSPNYMLISPDVLPVLTFINGFTASPAGTVAGPYMAGTLNSLKVYVTPNIDDGVYVIGVNGSDLMSSAAVYAPYMAIVPTSLLQFADGATSQGFSTMYDLKLLNTVPAESSTAGVDGFYSRLLAKGHVVA